MPAGRVLLASLIMACAAAVVLALSFVGGKDSSLLQRYLNGTEPPRILPTRS